MNGTVERSVNTTVTRLAWGQVRRGVLVVASVAGGMSALVVAMHRGLFGTGVDVAEFAALAANPAIRILFGTPVALEDPGGFAVWRTGPPLAVIVSAWAVVTATRITRGEESAGRWDLVLAGRTTVRSVVARHTAVIALGAASTGAAVCAALPAAGTAVAGAVVHGGGVALVGVFFAGVGVACAQVFTSRAAATGAGIAVVGLSLLARMFGDGVAALGWMRWVSPFGLLAVSRPFAGDRWGPLVVLAVAAVAAVGVAVVLAGRRDIRAGILAAQPSRRPRPWLLGSVDGFAIRGAVGVLAGWSVAIGAYFLLVGALSGSVTEFLADSPRFTDLAAAAGFAGLERVDGFAAALFAALAVPVGMYTVIRTVRLATDETDGRLTLLLAGPVTRHRILAAHGAATLGGAAVLATVAAVTMWAGAVLSGTGLGLAAALGGAWNIWPIVALSLAAAVLALGTLPRAVAVIGALPAGGGFLLHSIATVAEAPTWVAEVSPFSHLAPVPAAPANWPAGVVMTAVAVGVAMAGAAAYRGRDLRA